MKALDSHTRLPHIRALLERKPSLRRLYEEVYRDYAACLERCPDRGVALELGSGAGFAKRIVPELVTSDVVPYEGVDEVVDATRLPFGGETLRFIGMLNVFHHIPDVEAFLGEAQRCLLPGGKIFIVDQHPGIISTPILRYLHHEPFDPGAESWRFESTGPLSGANGALAWIVFVRDRPRFRSCFPALCLCEYRPHTPLRYWMTGGLKRWNLLPGWAFGLASRLDRLLARLSPKLGSFVSIEIVKTTSGGASQAPR